MYGGMYGERGMRLGGNMNAGMGMGDILMAAEACIYILCYDA